MYIKIHQTMRKESIKDIIGFEGLYKISSSGKIWRYKSKKRLVNGKFLELPERELKIGGKVNYPNSFFIERW